MKVSFPLHQLNQFIQFILINHFFLKLFIQFNERKRQEQVENLLTYKIDPIDIPKDLGNSKGIIESPWLKIELTKANAFKVLTFREYLDIKRKVR
jgi:hypothetical protein